MSITSTLQSLQHFNTSTLPSLLSLSYSSAPCSDMIIVSITEQSFLS